MKNPVTRGTVAGCLYEQGMSYKEIAKELGVGVGQAYNIISETPEFRENVRKPYALGKPVPRGTVMGRLFERGLSYPDIAETMGLSKSHVAHTVRRTPEWQEYHKHQEAMDDLILELHKEGFDSGEIAEATGRTATAIQQWLRYHGHSRGYKTKAVDAAAAWKIYRNTSRSLDDIAKEFGTSSFLLTKRFTKLYPEEYRKRVVASKQGRRRKVR